MAFQKGQSGNPKGRTPGTRSIAIDIIFRLMARYQEQFEKQMDLKARESIIKFYDSYVQPLQPTKFDLSGEIAQKIINVTRPSSLKEDTDGRKSPDVSG